MSVALGTRVVSTARMESCVQHSVDDVIPSSQGARRSRRPRRGWGDRERCVQLYACSLTARLSSLVLRSSFILPHSALHTTAALPTHLHPSPLPEAAFFACPQFFPGFMSVWKTLCKISDMGHLRYHGESWGDPAGYVRTSAGRHVSSHLRL